MIDYPHVTQIVQAAGLSNYSGVPENIMEAARNRGDVGHKTCELYDLENLDMNSVDERISPYLQAYIKFLKDFDLKFTKDEIEKQLVSKMGFVGTPDRISKAKGLAIDIKLTHSLLPVLAIQLAGYQILAEESGIRIKKRVGVQLKGDATYLIQEYKSLSDKNIFLSCLNIYNWKKEHRLLDKVVDI